MAPSTSERVKVRKLKELYPRLPQRELLVCQHLFKVMFPIGVFFLSYTVLAAALSSVSAPISEQPVQRSDSRLQVPCTLNLMFQVLADVWGAVLLRPKHFGGKSQSLDGDFDTQARNAIGKVQDIVGLGVPTRSSISEHAGVLANVKTSSINVTQLTIRYFEVSLPRITEAFWNESFLCFSMCFLRCEISYHEMSRCQMGSLNKNCEVNLPSHFIQPC